MSETDLELDEELERVNAEDDNGGQRRLRLNGRHHQPDGHHGENTPTQSHVSHRLRVRFPVMASFHRQITRELVTEADQCYSTITISNTTNEYEWDNVNAKYNYRRS